MYTAAIESGLGRFLTQLNNGKAQGIFQIEPETEQTILNWVNAKGNAQWKDLLLKQLDNTSYPRMIYDLEYQIVMARLNYYRFPDKLPSKSNKEAVYDYYKKLWNTHLGATTKEKAETRVRKVYPEFFNQ